MNDNDKKKDQHQNTADTGDGDKPKPPESGPIHFKVNGVELVSKKDKLLASEILEMAKDKGAFGDKPDEYYLEEVREDGSEKKYKSDEWVQLWAGAEFMALQSAGTPFSWGNVND